MAGEHRIRILHISDLHARGARDGKRRWKRNDVLGDAWKRNLDELAGDAQRFDVVAFTGDVADWGLAEEYQQATPFVVTHRSRPTPMHETIARAWRRVS